MRGRGAMRNGRQAAELARRPGFDSRDHWERRAAHASSLAHRPPHVTTEFSIDYSSEINGWRYNVRMTFTPFDPAVLLDMRDEFRVAGTRWHLDARGPRVACAVSHAHADHLGCHALTLATPETCAILAHRLDMREDASEETPSLFGPLDVSCPRQVIRLPYRELYTEGDLRLDLFPAGHVLGSAMIRATTPAGTLPIYGRLPPACRCPDRACVRVAPRSGGCAADGMHLRESPVPVSASGEGGRSALHARGRSLGRGQAAGGLLLFIGQGARGGADSERSWVWREDARRAVCDKRNLHAKRH